MKKEKICIKRFGKGLGIMCVEQELVKEDIEISAVLMTEYGIDTVILSEHERIESLVEEFENSEDSKWEHGLGKTAMYSVLHKKLLKENGYFNKNPQKMNFKNKRWLHYCDECVILAALGNVLYEKPILLMHPQSFKQSVKCNKEAWLNGAKGMLPTLIKGIEVKATNPYTQQ